MADNRRARGEGFYYLSRGQLTILAVSFTVTSVVIFFLGILIGQGIEERKLLKIKDPVNKILIQPLSEGTASSTGTPTEHQLTFYDTLTPPPPDTETKTEASDRKAQVEEGAVKGEPTQAKAPTEDQARTAPPKAKKKTNEATREQGSPWSVQVRASVRESDAQDLAEKLKTKGFDAYVIPTKGKGRKWYRVRVGHLPTREQAEQLLETLKTKENYTEAIIRRGG